MAVIQSSDLDFFQIKQNLKTYLEQQPDFTDYNFEASGISNILDVLAYNTHMNGLIANMGINESFLSSAQLRSSVVSHAETLGYSIRSKTASMATVGLTISTSTTNVDTVTINKGFTFTTNVDDVSYTFQTTNEIIGRNNGSGLFTFETTSGSKAIPIYEGKERTKTFIVGESTDQQVYVIPDENLDTSTLSVDVYDTYTSSTFISYLDVNDVVRINSNSTVYMVREVPNGYYELTFSNGNVLGKEPVSGNKIVVTYLASNGADGNGASTFEADAQIDIDNTDYNVVVETLTNSAGGDEKESIPSIKSNAPRGFATQQRMVTAEDYKSIILQRYSSVLQDVTAWGGNDNVPPIYGRVYVSLQFKGGISDETKDLTKESIKNQLSQNLAIMSIDTFYTDPVNTYLEINTTFRFNPEQSSGTQQTAESQVKAAVADYVSANLNKFDSVFRRSQVLAAIDDIGPAILNSSMEVRVQQRVESLDLGVSQDYDVSFPVKLASPDDKNYIVTSTRFTFGGRTCYLRNKLNTSKLQIATVGDGFVVSDNVGTYDKDKGTVNIRGVNISAIEGSVFKVTATPANQSTITPLRNYIIRVDTDVSTARAVLDYEETASSL